MADKQYWAGSTGPFIYDDTDTYPDGKNLEAARVPQVYIEDAPTESHHAVRFDYLGTFVPSGATSSVASAISRVESKLTSGDAIGDSKTNSALSKVESGIGSEATRADSNAKTLADSATLAGGGSTASQVGSTATSQNVSQSLNISTVDSRVSSGGGGGTDASQAASLATSQNTSQSTNVSVADSKGVSAGSLTKTLFSDTNGWGSTSAGSGATANGAEWDSTIPATIGMGFFIGGNANADVVQFVYDGATLSVLHVNQGYVDASSTPGSNRYGLYVSGGTLRVKHNFTGNRYFAIIWFGRVS